MNKYCPLRPAMVRCWKEDCAWYLVHSKQCAVPLLASQFQMIRIQLMSLTEEAGYKTVKKCTRQVRKSDSL